MRKLINGKVRNTGKMTTVCSRSGNRNDCYSMFSVVLKDERDNTYYHFSGHNWSGVGNDTLAALDNPKEHIEQSGYELTEDQSKVVESM